MLEWLACWYDSFDCLQRWLMIQGKEMTFRQKLSLLEASNYTNTSIYIYFTVVYKIVEGDWDQLGLALCFLVDCVRFSILWVPRTFITTCNNPRPADLCSFDLPSWSWWGIDKAEILLSFLQGDLSFSF